jgi:hypothetical protein
MNTRKIVIRAALVLIGLPIVFIAASVKAPPDRLSFEPLASGRAVLC